MNYFATNRNIIQREIDNGILCIADGKFIMHVIYLIITDIKFWDACDTFKKAYIKFKTACIINDCINFNVYYMNFEMNVLILLRFVMLQVLIWLQMVKFFCNGCYEFKCLRFWR